MRRSALGFVGFGEFVERAFENRLAGKDLRNVIPAIGVFAEAQVKNPGDRGLVLLVRFDPAIIDGELFEIGENAERQLG